jgi:cytochrome c
MRSMIVAGMVVLGVAMAGSANASEELAKKAGCTNCHANAEKKVGPSLKDIAAKFKGEAGADATLVAKLKEGKEHPATKASDEDLKKIVKWILAR